ncbi:MAG: DUF1365 domain-containing protein [Panacagrimonas sp.]
MGALVKQATPAPAEAGELYVARVMHRRRVAPFYRFVYRVFYLLLDVDQLDALHQRLRWFSHNRFNLLALHDRDHGAVGAGSLRQWAEALLGESGIDLQGGRIRLLCMPRLLGYAFNPIGLWYCEYADGQLAAVIAEVRNTFGEKHCYLLASNGAPLTYGDAWDKQKCFHVSPFFDTQGQYRFRLSPPSQRLRVMIHETRDNQPILDACLAAERRAMTNANLLKQVLAMPWMTLKVMWGIHWEALKIWLRGGRYHSKPKPPLSSVS